MGLALPAPADDGRSLHVAVIQTNIPRALKWDPAERPAMLRKIDGLIDRTLADGPDVIALPETAVAGFVRFEDDLTAWVKGAVVRTRRPLLFGSLDRAEKPPFQLSNVAILITPYNTVTTYRKRRLLAVAEYLPRLGPLSGWLARLRGDEGALTPGEEATLFRLADGTTFGTLICYEDGSAELARECAAAGAEALFALGNAMEFQGTSQPLQQLRRARLTAVAVGLPLVRCSNGGVSCVLDASGRLRATLTDEPGALPLEEGARVLRVPLGGGETVYRRCGDPLPLAAFAALVVLAVAGRWLGELARREPRELTVPFLLDPPCYARREVDPSRSS